MPPLFINFRFTSAVWIAIMFPINAIIIGLGVYAANSAPLAALPTFFSLLVPLSLLINTPRTLLRQDRTIRAANRGDSRLAPLVINPPDPAKILAPDETIQMTRTVSRAAILKAGSSVLILAIIIIIFTELLVALAFATQQNRFGNSLPSWLFWFFALAPLVVWGGLVANQYFFLAREGQFTISANNQGITLKQSLVKPQFIPWDDIHVWLRGVGHSSDPYLSSYALIGYHHSLALQFNSAFNLRNPSAKPLLATTYVGGIVHYRAQARQLLVMIAARGKAPLRTFPQGFYGPGERRAFPFAQMTITDIAALPVADSTLLPSATETQAMQAHPGPLSLRQRPKLPIRLLLFLGIVSISIIAITSAVSISGGNSLNAFTGYFLSFILVVLVLLGIRFSINPSISVDAQGVRGSAANRQMMIPWQKVRYWVVAPPDADHPNDLLYGIFSDGPTLTWRVPVIMGTDPQSVAQRANAEAFHAMIAARTGQPPRQLPAC